MSINLSLLPAPDVVEPLDFETILATIKADLIALAPEMAAALALESEPASKLCEVFAYRELLLRARINDAASSVMLAYARGADLDNLGALFGVTRLLLDPGDPTEPRPPVYESDEDFRRRITLAPESFSVAGPEGAYIYHVLSAHPDVLDAAVSSPTPGKVRVTILSRQGSGSPSNALVNAVKAALTASTVRPLTDQVEVKKATIVNYSVTATIYTHPGPDASLVLAQSEQRLSDYVQQLHRLGRDVPVSGLHAMLHGEGVQRVEMTAPGADVTITPTQASYCTAINVTLGANSG